VKIYNFEIRLKIEVMFTLKSYPQVEFFCVINLF